MRQMRDGCLLLELPKGASSTSAAKKIVSAMTSSLGNSVGKVQQLGLQVEVEVLDIDAAATAQEVLDALRDAIPWQDDPAAKVDREVICDVRIWGTRSGQQIATAKMPKHLAVLITRVPIGWTMCRVRARTLPPERCFRFHAFGHNARDCKAADRTGACWKCGVTGHAMKDCVKANDRCVACESAGLPRVDHKPGSGACAARRQSAEPATMYRLLQINLNANWSAEQLMVQTAVEKGTDVLIIPTTVGMTGGASATTVRQPLAYHIIASSATTTGALETASSGCPSRT